MFSQKTFDFLVENRFRNSKEWFQEHRDIYLGTVVQPLEALSISLAPTISAIDSLLITNPKKTVSRIYCDIRFSKEKLLYREEMWLSFRRDKKTFPNYPEFFFAISPNEFSYGCGYYAASADTMNAIRKLILKKDPKFLRARQAFEQQRHFIIDGPMYKKSKYSDQADSLKNWLDRKSICFLYNSADFSELYSENLVSGIKDTFLRLKPIYEFFICAENYRQMESRH